MRGDPCYRPRFTDLVARSEIDLLFATMFRVFSSTFDSHVSTSFPLNRFVVQLNTVIPRLSTSNAHRVQGEMGDAHTAMIQKAFFRYWLRKRDAICRIDAVVRSGDPEAMGGERSKSRERGQLDINEDLAGLHRDMTGNAVQPTSYLLSTASIDSLAGQNQKGCLERILGIVTGSKDPEADALPHLRMTMNRSGKRLVIPREEFRSVLRQSPPATTPKFVANVLSIASSTTFRELLRSAEEVGDRWGSLRTKA